MSPAVVPGVSPVAALFDVHNFHRQSKMCFVTSKEERLRSLIRINDQQISPARSLVSGEIEMTLYYTIIHEHQYTQAHEGEMLPSSA